MSDGHGTYLRRSIFAAFVIMTSGFPSGGASAMPPAVYRLGKPAAVGAFAVVLLGVDGKSSGSHHLITLRYTVKNISSTPVSQSALPQLRLESASHDFYDALEAGRPDAKSQLPPGSVLELTASFEIPADSFDAKTWRARVGGEQGARIRLF